MAGVDLTIVREYFALNGFVTRDLRKPQPKRRRKSGPRKAEERVELLALNPEPKAREGELPFTLFPNDLPAVERAIVSVEGAYLGRSATAPLRSAEIYAFLEKDVIKQVDDLFAVEAHELDGYGPLLKILVVPGLPMQDPHRTQSVDLLREHGVQAIISFRLMLQDIVERMNLNHHYETNDVLETLRVLKHFEMIRPPQMEMFDRRR